MEKKLTALIIALQAMLTPRKTRNPAVAIDAVVVDRTPTKG